MNRKILISAMLILLGGIGGFFAHRLLSGDPMKNSLADIHRCFKEKNPILCSRPVIEMLLETKNPTEVMDEFGKELKPAECHYVGHVVGQQSYIKYQNIEDVIAMCGRGCDSACLHGAIGEVFAEQLGFGSPDEASGIDLEHLTLDQIKRIGKSLCTTAEACHGAGHAIFQATKDMTKSMKICDDIAPIISSCYNGVAMEYADILANRNMRAIDGVKYPEPEELSALCLQLPSIIEQRSCFRYFPRMVTETYKTKGATQKEGEVKVAEICGAYKTRALKTACYSGIGAHNAYFVLTDQPAAIKVCTAISGQRNQGACFFGEVAVAVEERQDKLLKLCTIMPDDTFKMNCYHQIFYYLKKFGVPGDREKMCGTGNALCDQGFKEQDVNPWDEMLKTYKD